MNRRTSFIYYLGKVISAVLSIFVLSVCVFSISRFAPGDPLVSYYGDRAEKMSMEERAWAEDKLGLNESIFVQYVRWAENAVQGDFGISFKYKKDVLQVLESRIGNTLVLGGIGFVIIFICSLLLGILCAMHEDRWLDRVICKVGTVISCIPEFWLSLLLILVFAVTLKWLPIGGAYSIGNENNVVDRMNHLIMPLAVVVFSHLWYYAYMVRNKLVEELSADYVVLAKVKGLTRHQIVFKHCVRNILPVYLGIMAISVPHILGGTYIVEAVFSYPGMGQLFYESARYQDYNLLMIISILSGALVIMSNSVAQIINERIDPRLKVRHKAEISEVADNG